MSNTIIWRLSTAATNQVLGQFELPEDGTVTIGRTSDADIVLPDSSVSRRHATLTIQENNISVADTGSANGTTINGRVVEDELWFAGETLEIGPYVLECVGDEIARTRQPRKPAAEPFPPPFFDRPVVSIEELRATGKLVSETDYLALGGGLGSFVWVDHLRVFGVPRHQIRVIGVDSVPYAKYKRLCLYSQIPDYERLRSNSISTPDNIWGVPGYASREAWSGIARGRLHHIKYILQTFGEPALCPSYTPRAGDVYDSMDREAARIGWSDMLNLGRLLKVRKTDDGRYAVAYRISSGETTSSIRERFAVGRFIHIATGYPASRYLDDIQEFKRAHPNSRRVVNAYEEHDEIYQDLENTRNGSVIVRGRGIVASRILQRLGEVRRTNPNVRVLHVMRSPIRNGRRYDLARRHAANDIEFQPFNWPKAAWGGTLRRRLEATPPDKRYLLMEQWAGTTTADRPDWNDLIEDGKREGWYRPFFGDVKEMTPEGDTLALRLKSAGEFEEDAILKADFVIDCTGLIADLSANPVINDLLSTYDLRRNLAGERANGEKVRTGLYVSNSFEIEGLRNGPGRAYAAGVLTTNGPYAAVDSFLGLQYAALRSVDALRKTSAPAVSRFGMFKSLSQWLRWCTNASP